MSAELWFEIDEVVETTLPNGAVTVGVRLKDERGRPLAQLDLRVPNPKDAAAELRSALDNSRQALVRIAFEPANATIGASFFADAYRTRTVAKR